MSRIEIAEMSAAEHVSDLASLARDAVRYAVDWRSRPMMKKSYAMDEAGRAYRLMARRIRAIYSNEIVDPPQEQAARIIQFWWEDRQTEVEVARANLEQLERELERDRAIVFGPQFELPLRSAHAKKNNEAHRRHANALASLRHGLDRMEHHAQRAAEAEARYRRARS